MAGMQSRPVLIMRAGTSWRGASAMMASRHMRADSAGPGCTKRDERRAWRMFSSAACLRSAL